MSEYYTRMKITLLRSGYSLDFINSQTIEYLQLLYDYWRMWG